MSEMLEIVSELILLFGLFYVAWIDYRMKWIPVVPILGLGTMGLLIRLSTGLLEWKLILGMLVGVILMVISILTAESVGMGDALLFISTGMFLDVTSNIALLFGTLLLAGTFSLGCLLLKKKGKHDRVAMGPFILAAYVMLIL